MKLLSQTVMVLFVALFAAPAAAILVQITDASSPGGTNNVTRDTATNLEWLDWTASTAISFDSMITMFGSGGTYEGWGHASRDQVRVFMATASLPTANWPSSSTTTDGGAAYTLFSSLVGETLFTKLPRAQGVTSDPDTPGHHFYAIALRNGLNSNSRADNSQTDATSAASVGHALVRVAVPEPSTLTLLGLGLTGMSFLGWRRKRKQASVAS